MPKVLFTGDESMEQAVGATVDNSLNQIYLVKRTEPRNYIFLGGHRIDDAPSYEITEAVLSPSYRFLNGRNQVVNTPMTYEQVKGVSFTVALPNRMLSVTDRLFADQRECDFDMLIIPSSCDAGGCNEYFWYGADAIIGASQITNAPVGYDENLAPINRTRTVTISGQLRTVLGKEVKELSQAAGALYAVAVVDNANGGCLDCGCPFQTIYRGGASTSLEYSTNGGATWTAITTTAVSTDVVSAIITSIDYKDGRVIMGYSDVANGTGTDGGVAYSVDNGAAVLSTMGTASLGIQKVVRAFNKVYAVGTAGEVFESTDEGASFTKLTQSLTSEDLIDAVYDSKNGFLHIVGTSGAYITFDGTNFVDETSNLNAGAVDLFSVAVSGDATVWIGAGDGNLYVNDNFSAGSTAWVSATNVTNAVGAIAVDPRGHELYFGETAELHRLGAMTFASSASFATLSGNATGAFVTEARSDEFGVDVYHIVTSDGSHYSIQSCNICVQ